MSIAKKLISRVSVLLEEIEDLRQGRRSTTTKKPNSQYPLSTVAASMDSDSEMSISESVIVSEKIRHN
jgi:hypothetical protein